MQPSRSKSVTPEYVIELERVEDVELEGNVIEDVGPYGKGELRRDEEEAGAAE